MKKTISQRFFLSLCLMIVGCLWGSAAWAETATYRHVFTAKPSTGNNVTLSGVAWNISATNLSNNYNNQYAGVQFGTSSLNGQITLTSSSDWDYNGKTKITEVRLWLNRGGTSVTPTVTIGGKDATSDGKNVGKNTSAGTDWTKTSKVTFTPAVDGNTGVIEIDVTSVKAGYICALEIDCEEGAPSPHYTVSWMVNGETYTEGTPSTDVAEGKKVETLPTNPANIGSNVFMGWTASEISETPAGAPADLFTTAKDAPVVTGETTYYAVFAEATANGTHWEEIKALPEPGRYAILSDSYFMSSTISSTRFQNGSTTPKISSTTPATLTAAPLENCIWEITKPDSYYRIANGGKYAGGTGSKNQGAMLSDASNNFAKWTIEYSGSAFNVINYGRSQSSSNSGNKYLRNNETNGWACYASGTGDAPRLFKETTSYSYSNYATTIVVKEEAGLAFKQATYNVEVDGIITVTATNVSGADITYSVDDGTHAIVDENTGVFYADAVGTYTITATCPETGTHYAGMTTCQVIVTQPAANIHATTYYKKITSSDELVDGGVYLIVCERKNEAMGVINNSEGRCLGATITLSGNTYTGSVNQSDYPYEVTITKGNNGYYNLYHAGGKYITSTSTDFAFAAKGDNGWSISFDGGNAIISNKNTAGNYIQRYNSNNYYKNYQSVQTPIQLYQKVGEMPIAKATGYVSTYVADFAYVMPKHITGHTVALADKQDVIITKKAFRAGDEVPAFTPLLIKSDEDYDAEENSRNYNPAVLNKTVDAYTGENMLEYRRTAENYTNTMKNGNVYYYKLAIKNDKVGFYWGAAGGAAFKMTKPSTAYLTVPQTMTVQGFVLNLEEGATTGIATVVTNEDAPIYNLQGIRMNGKNLPKGIYIQGGKKFMVK